VKKRFGISDQVWRRICEVFEAHPQVEEVLLYGSRAKGAHRDASDIDMVLKGDELSLTDQFRLETELDDLLLPWHIELCRYHAIQDEAFRREIDRWGQSVYRKEEAQKGTVG
jgi:predicted nucleotidyltransferase